MSERARNGDLAIARESHGDGPPLVLLPGTHVSILEGFLLA